MPRRNLGCLAPFHWSSGRFPAIGSAAVLCCLLCAVPACSETPKTSAVVLGDGVELELVGIPGGTFWMGCSPEDQRCLSDEKPRHQVRVDGFWMSRFEITQRQWQAVMGSSENRFPGPDQPAEGMTWERAQEFLRKAGHGLRLPTEAEWEYAARAGSASARHGELDEVAWYGSNSGDETVESVALFREAENPFDFFEAMVKLGCRSHPVGTKRPNAFGLHDMLGNMFEWCQDTYKADAFLARESVLTENPLVTTDEGGLRVIRGGAWVDPPFIVRASTRAFSKLGTRFPDSLLGLRVARSEPWEE